LIEKTDAIAVLERNLHRTEMLIEAMVKIKAVNRLYQMAQAGDPEYVKVVRKVQDQQLAHIERSCGEHAVISLATAFETYYKELLQQLLYEHPSYFLSRHTGYSGKLNALMEATEPVTHEEIGQVLKLGNRFEYCEFFEAYSIPFLSTDEQKFIQYVYLRRNSYVHSAGKLDKKTREKLAATPPPYDVDAISTEAKRLRTKFSRMLYKSHDRVTAFLGKKK
jgi:hypothetical protein